MPRRADAENVRQMIKVRRFLRPTYARLCLIVYKLDFVVFIIPRPTEKLLCFLSMSGNMNRAILSRRLICYANPRKGSSISVLPFTISGTKISPKSRSSCDAALRIHTFHSTHLSTFQYSRVSLLCFTATHRIIKTFEVLLSNVYIL